ncbi:MAG: 2-oxoacid:acceptor oxidoreductase subunit alpha [Planctomycetota bacterium]|nr:2-oxoacid:acceptor oxidoreductase subunit alpha [Planctomycetota bacterium]
MTSNQEPNQGQTLQQVDRVVIRFAGDSGDGIQITGNQFTMTSALAGNDLATLPDFPAEIRAPVGTRAGVSGFQIQFSANDIHTPGDEPDVLVAMNPAALVVNLKSIKRGGIIVVNTGNFKDQDLKKAKLDSNPLEDGSLESYRVIPVNVNERVMEALADSPLNTKGKERCKNFYTLGLMYWLYSRPLEPTLEWLADKFKKNPDLVAANQAALRAGYNAGDIHEIFQGQYEVPKTSDLPQGTYRNVVGNHAVAMGFVAAGRLSNLNLFLGSYPITPASTVLETLANYKEYGVTTFQAEDEIAAICAAIGASFGGALGITTTSGPGMALKTEALGLAMAVELPLVVLNVQRAGPSTGLPTKVEQSDLYQALWGRNGDTPIPVVAIASASDAFELTIEACRIAVEYMTPVILLSDNFIANGAEPWLLPDVDALPKFPAKFKTEADDKPIYDRDAKGARPWIKPGTPGLEHRIGGLERDNKGSVSSDPENHQRMSDIRNEKIRGIAKELPTPEVQGAQNGDLLLLGWGSTIGSLKRCLEKATDRGHKVGRVHMRHLWPLAPGLDEIFSRYKTILVPELNMGQLVTLLRSEYPSHNFVSLTKVTGLPFLTSEIDAEVDRLLA